MPPLLDDDGYAERPTGISGNSRSSFTKTCGRLEVTYNSDGENAK